MKNVPDENYTDEHFFFFVGSVYHKILSIGPNDNIYSYYEIDTLE